MLRQTQVQKVVDEKHNETVKNLALSTCLVHRSVVGNSTGVSPRRIHAGRKGGGSVLTGTAASKAERRA